MTSNVTIIIIIIIITKKKINQNLSFPCVARQTWNVTEINPKCLRWSCSCSQWPLLWQRFSFWRLKIMVMVIVLYSAPSLWHIQNYAHYKESIRMKQSPTTTPRTTCINVYLIYNTWWCMFIGLSIWKINDKLFENCFDYIFLTIV